MNSLDESPKTHKNANKTEPDVRSMKETFSEYQSVFLFDSF